MENEAGGLRHALVFRETVHRLLSPHNAFDQEALEVFGSAMGVMLAGALEINDREDLSRPVMFARAAADLCRYVCPRLQVAESSGATIRLAGGRPPPKSDPARLELLLRTMLEQAAARGLGGGLCTIAQEEEGLEIALDLTRHSMRRLANPWSLVNRARDVVLAVDRQGRFVFLNPEFERVTGYSREEALGQEFCFLVPEESRASAVRDFQESIQCAVPLEAFETEVLTKSGERLRAEVRWWPCLDGERTIGAYGIARDVTRRHRVEQDTIRRNRELDLLNQVAVAVGGSLNPEEILAVALEKAMQLTGAQTGAIYLLDQESGNLTLRLSRGPQGGHLPLRRVKPGQGLAGKVLQSGLPVVTNSDPLTRGARQKRAASVPLVSRQKVLGVMELAGLEQDEPAERLVELLTTVGSQVGVALENAWLFARLEEQAHYDYLTGLYSRQHFEELLEHEVRRAKRYRSHLAVLLLDLNGLKEINDTFGHARGDQALQAVGRLLRATLRESDIAARYGGDEFVVLLPELDVNGARAALRRFRGRIATFNRRRQLPFAISLSAGASADVAGGHELLDEADRDMYADKRAWLDRRELALR